MKTFGDLKAQVEMELDIQDEEFVQTAELQGYFNSAVTLVESTIVKLGLRERYLQTETFISTVAGQQDYPLPNDIVAQKIRKVIYRNSSATIYTVKPAAGENAYVLEDVLKNQPSSEFYHYQLFKANGVNYFRLMPVPALSVPNAIRMIYYVALNRYTADSVVCDVPDMAYEVILSYVRYRIYAKEGPSNQNAMNEKQDYTALLSMMTDTLQNQVADPDMDIMDRDVSHYEDMA